MLRAQRCSQSRDRCDPRRRAIRMSRLEYEGSLSSLLYCRRSNRLNRLYDAKKPHAPIAPSADRRRLRRSTSTCCSLQWRFSRKPSDGCKPDVATLKQATNTAYDGQSVTVLTLSDVTSTFNVEKYTCTKQIPSRSHRGRITHRSDRHCGLRVPPNAKSIMLLVGRGARDSHTQVLKTCRAPY